MNKLTYEQMHQVLDNFVRRCPGISQDGGICGQMLQPLSTLCRFCNTSTPMPKIFKDSFIEHFELRFCPIAKDSTFWYCIHPKIDSQIEDLIQFCNHCIILETAATDIEILHTKDQ